MKYSFNLVLSLFVLFQVFLSEAYSTELQDEQHRTYVYFMRAPKVEERKQEFIVRQVRTRDEFNNQENFRQKGFKINVLNNVAILLNDNKDFFLDHYRLDHYMLTLINFSYPAVQTIETILRSIHPYSIESRYEDNIPEDPDVSNFLARLRNEEDERQERLCANVERPKLDFGGQQQEMQVTREERRDLHESNSKGQ